MMPQDFLGLNFVQVTILSHPSAPGLVGALQDAAVAVTTFTR